MTDVLIGVAIVVGLAWFAWHNVKDWWWDA